MVMKLFLLLLFCTAAHGQIIFLVSPPRSLSTAFLRMMEARQDFILFNEPFVPFFFHTHFTNMTAFKKQFKEDTPTTIESIHAAIGTAASSHHVFVKEISFALYDALRTDDTFIHDTNVKFVFLVRSPHHATISLCKKLIAFYGPGQLKHATIYTGYKEMYHLLQYISAHRAQKPLLIHAQDLYTCPAATIQLFCTYCNLEYNPQHLIWEPKDAATIHESWHEAKQSSLIQFFHHDALSSSQFVQPTIYQTDNNGNPTFAEIEHPDDKKICADLFEKNKRYYNLILNTFAA
jgi:hypothetical protein